MTLESLDRSVLRQLEEDLGSASALREVIGTFLETAPRLLVALRDAAAAGDASGVRRAAHTIKASSLMLGARDLAARCEDLERRGRAGDVSDAMPEVQAIEALYGAARLALEADAGEAR